MKKLCYLVALSGLIGLLANPTHVLAQTFTAKANVSITANTGGFYEYLPINYNQSQTHYPLLIFIHGLGELGDGGASQLSKVLVNGTPKQMKNGTFPTSFSVNGLSYSFLAIIPQFKKWPGANDIEAIINYAIENYRIDEDRIYLTGLSMGGGVVWDYVGSSLVRAKRIAAVVPICGATSPTNAKCEKIAAGNVAVWATHNSGDGTVSSSNTVGFVNGINSQPAPPTPPAKMTIFTSNSHDAWSKTYDLNFKEGGVNVYEWMLTFTRGSMSALPDEDLTVLLKKEGTHTLVEWSFIGDNDYTGFFIERSKDGKEFTSIGYVDAASGIAGKYRFEDTKPYEGKNYYRIKALKNSGRSIYSKVKNISLKTGVEFALYPNPVADMFRITTTYDMDNVQLVVTDMSGRRVMQKNLSGSGNHNIPVQLPAGIYSAAVVEKGDVIYRQSFVKQ
ncbi:MAG: T9SS type A sorting domain-containing protein [Chitinophagaceae bacterium]|nr:T9SS type A sorting domain-containing protein [Chitinophagaceae bacterium]